MVARQVLTADEGMVLTDGKIYGKVIYLAQGADASAFYEITDAAYAEILAEQERQIEEV